MKKVTFAIAALKASLARLNTINSGNTALTVLQNIQITVTTQSAVLQTSDLEITMQDTVECQSMDKFAFLVDKKELIDIVKDLPDGSIDFEYNEKDLKVTLVTPVGKFNLGVDKVEDFPAYPSLIFKRNVPLSKSVIEKIGIANGFTSNDQLRPAMTGVLFHFRDGMLYIVATDAHCLYKSEAIVAEGNDDREIIVSSSAIKAFTSSVYGKDVVMEITEPVRRGNHESQNQSHVVFRYGNTCIAIRLIDARYPDYNAVLPDHDQHFTVSVAEMRRKNKLALHTANNTTYQVAFSIADKKLYITSENIDFNKSSDIEPIELDRVMSEDFVFQFNGKMLDNVLSCFKGNVDIYNNALPNRAFVFKESPVAGKEDETCRDLILLMPLFGNAKKQD